MNPEFARNLWLELTPRRVVLMLAILGLIFAASAIGGGGAEPAETATWIYYLIVVVWGARSAALSVVGEIRERTWDGQRLSALGAATMVWGKLFGATIYNWLGGLICLGPMLVNLVAKDGIATAGIEICFYIGLGVIAQSAALLASLIAINRRSRHTQLGIALYQSFGIAAAVAAYLVWNVADPQTLLRGHLVVVDVIAWWGVSLDAKLFLLLSLIVFAAWLLVGCVRTMRVELKQPNGPFVWLGFLAFMGIYVAGFDAWLSPDLKGWDAVSLRLLLAGTTFVALTYVMVLLEPKDRVLYRWMGEQALGGRIGRALGAFQCWMMSYVAAALVTAALCFSLTHDAHAAAGQALALATLGFLTRDTAIFVLMQTLPGRRRGDWRAIAILFALYLLIPAIVSGMSGQGAMVLFYPQAQTPSWLGAGAAWVEGLLVAVLATTRLALSGSAGRRVAV
ncbi:MAG: hypothetical protein JSR60_14025 [Proteobacteria bacterium]|nr:hypothetical protein [Pseudomonadota bacterium]